MSKNIIKLNEDYGIGSDEIHFILHQRKVNQKEGSKNYSLPNIVNNKQKR